MEIDVRDDLMDPDNRILFFYDVSEVADLRNALGEGTGVHGLCGQSKAMQRVYKAIRSVARVDTTVLIEGETGTGKELVARAIHYGGHRKAEAFLAINCAGLTESLLTSQLFGHKRGSFTGALTDQVGLFEAAHRGTLFLDEVGDIPLSIQSSLLRVLQEKEITRIGEAQPRKVDVRIIAATHRDLGREVIAGNFRQDLFYRIRVATVELPPLRERPEDIDVLVAWLLGQTSLSMGLPEPQISSEAMDTLRAYRWPGNVRELRSALESALIQSNGPIIRSRDLPAEVIGSASDSRSGIRTDERIRLLEALARVNGNRTAAARLLQMSRATFYRSLARLNIRLDD
jgi:DNA-binding NtrC family response regulator